MTFVPQLRSYARSLLRDKDLADDLVQDCVQRAIEKLHLWRPESDLRAWLFTIMHNIFVSQIRRNAAAPTFVSSDDPENDFEQYYGVASQHETQTDMHKLEAAMTRLSNEHREVIHLVCIEEMTYDEVAKILDVPVGTVMSRLSRAREALRKLMYDNGAPNLRRVK